jgi:hypothetical protein
MTRRIPRGVNKVLFGFRLCFLSVGNNCFLILPLSTSTQSFGINEWGRWRRFVTVFRGTTIIVRRYLWNHGRPVAWCVPWLLSCHDGHVRKGRPPGFRRSYTSPVGGSGSWDQHVTCRYSREVGGRRRGNLQEPTVTTMFRHGRHKIVTKRKLACPQKQWRRSKNCVFNFQNSDVCHGCIMSITGITLISIKLLFSPLLSGSDLSPRLGAEPSGKLETSLT